MMYMSSADDFDGVQYDTFYAPSSEQLEAEEIRRECAGLIVCQTCGAPLQRDWAGWSHKRRPARRHVVRVAS